MVCILKMLFLDLKVPLSSYPSLSLVDRYVILANNRKTLSDKENMTESSNALLEVSKTLGQLKKDKGTKRSELRLHSLQLFANNYRLVNRLETIAYHSVLQFRIEGSRRIQFRFVGTNVQAHYNATNCSVSGRQTTDTRYKNSTALWIKKKKN